jgi:hypothetical protein
LVFVLGLGSGCDPNINLGSFGPAIAPDGSMSDVDVREAQFTEVDTSESRDSNSVGDFGPVEAADASPLDSDVDDTGKLDVVDAGRGILWSSDFEVGDLSEWTGDGQGGIYQESASALPTTVASQGHGGGMRAGRITVTPPASAMVCVNYIYRQAPMPADAYYSAWFWFPLLFSIPNYLNIIHFAGSTTNDDRALVSIWDVDLQSQADGSLAAYLFQFPVPNFASGRSYDEATPVPVPIMSWVHFEVLFRKASDNTGRIAVWQDGTLVLEVNDVATIPTDFLRFNIGGASRDITPAPADILVDDAAISTVRLGP